VVVDSDAARAVDASKRQHIKLANHQLVDHVHAELTDDHEPIASERIHCADDHNDFVRQSSVRH
jgi:hypothetical protein